MALIEGQAAREASLLSVLPGHPDLRCRPLNDELAGLLVARTLDPDDQRLHDMTSDLARFSSREALEKWVRTRKVLCLVDASEALHGVVWVGRKPLPERDDYFDPLLMRKRGPKLTWAIRLYGSVRGSDVSFDFAEHALHVLLDGRRGPSSLWYQTKAQNTAARSLGKRMDFFEASGEENGAVVGVRFATS